jgi:hypothetical protein
MRQADGKLSGVTRKGCGASVIGKIFQIFIK